MSAQPSLQLFLDKLAILVSSNQLVKLSMSNYQGDQEDLKNIYVRKAIVRRSEVLSFTYRYKTRDIIKNFEISEGLNLIGALLTSDFKSCTILGTDRQINFERLKKAAVVLKEKVLEVERQPNLSHNREKDRLIKPEGKAYLHELDIADSGGRIHKRAQDKYRQISRYIEIIAGLLKELPDQKIRTVVDMGSGKGYLTFALYDYLRNLSNADVSVTGVEFRKDLVDLCNGISERSGFDKLSFVQGTIDDFSLPSIDMLIALHACDTATDDAILKGIKSGAKLIIAAPCCHKQIRREMEANKVKNETSFLTKYGIFLERQAEMVTDGMRALILEYFGYRTKVFEFISDVHTPKNVLIVGIRHAVTDTRKVDILDELEAIKRNFGIGYHHLERRLFE